MVDKNYIERAFADFYQELWTRKSLVDVLASRMDKLLYQAFYAAYVRGYSEGMDAGLKRAEDRAERLRASRERTARVTHRTQTVLEPPGTVVTSRNPEGTASATHIPITIEGTIALDRDRPIGEYLGEDQP